MLSDPENFHIHSLPPFANEHNKLLSAVIKEKTATLSGLCALYDDSISRTEAMIAHKKNVHQELLHTQAIYDAKSRQIETEDHLKQVADREAGRLGMEIKRMEKEISEITDHLNTIQNNVYKGNEKIDFIRTELKLEKNELDEWLRVQAEKEEDSLALLQYTKEDEAKIKEFNMQIEKLMVEVNKKKNTLSAEVTETQVAQIELDKTTEAFKRLHQERQELIQKWEDSLKTMQQRDLEITAAQESHQKYQEEIRQKQLIIDEKQTFLDQQLLDNSAMEKKIGACDRNVSKYRYEQTEATNSLEQFQDEVEVLRNTLNKTATNLVNKRSEIINLKTDLQEKQAKLEKEKLHRTEMKEKLLSITNDTMTLEAKAAELQEILKMEETRNKELDRELKILREQHFKKSQELFKLKQEEKNITAERTGGEAAIKNLKSKIHKLDQEALKQQALLYAQEFQIQQLERKVRRAQGDRSDEEKEILLKRIEELTKDLEDQTKKYGLLNTQLKSSQEDLRQATRNYEKLTKEHRAVNEEIDELNLYNDSASHQLSAKTKEKEELFVESNLLRLELKKLRGFLSTRADQVFTLESRQLQLHLSLEERSKEIEINKEMLRLQIKTAQEERGSAHAELRDRVGKVEKLKRRYEILMTQFAPPEDGEDEDGSGEERTQAFYVIKAAQEREELQREGDELDAKIRKAEKEIKALENTLIMMNDRNEEYRMHLYKAELNAKDVQHKELLDQEYRQIMEQYKLKRLEIQDMQNDLLETERQLASLTTEESQRLQTVQLLESKISTLQRESGDQEAKRDRALKLARKKAKEWRSKAGAVIASEGGKIFGPGIVNEKDATPEEIDVMVRYLKDVGTIMIGDLNKVAERYPELSMRIHHLFEQSGIQQPSRAISRISSNDGYRDDMSVAGTPESRSSVHSRVSTNSLRNSVSRASGPVRSTTGSRLDMNAIVTLPSVSNNQNFPSRSSSSLQHYVTGSGNNPVVIPVPNNAQVNSSSGSSTPKRSSVRASRRGSAGSVGTQPK